MHIEVHANDDAMKAAALCRTMLSTALVSTMHFAATLFQMTAIGKHVNSHKSALTV